MLCFWYRVTFVWTHVQAAQRMESTQIPFKKKTAGNFQNLTTMSGLQLTTPSSSLFITLGSEQNYWAMGYVSRKPRKLFWPAKPFLDNLYLKSERCEHLKIFLYEENLCSYSEYASKTDLYSGLSFATAFRVRKLFGTFEKRTHGFNRVQ